MKKEKKESPEWVDILKELTKKSDVRIKLMMKDLNNL